MSLKMWCGNWNPIWKNSRTLPEVAGLLESGYWIKRRLLKGTKSVVGNTLCALLDPPQKILTGSHMLKESAALSFSPTNVTHSICFSTN